MLNEIFQLEGNESLDQYKDFDLINSFFKEKLGKDFILLEDLWFWGYFATKGSGKNRTIEFNEDKFYCAEFLKPTQENKELLLAFINILKE
ncbi:MAG: hypothetical protein ACPGR5_07525 [Chitinophagales bacterium]